MNKGDRTLLVSAPLEGQRMEWKIHVHQTKVQSKNLQKVGLHSINDKGIQVLSSFVKIFRNYKAKTII